MCISLHIPVRTIQLSAAFDGFPTITDKARLYGVGLPMTRSRILALMDSASIPE